MQDTAGSGVVAFVARHAVSVAFAAASLFGLVIVWPDSDAPNEAVAPPAPVAPAKAQPSDGVNTAAAPRAPTRTLREAAQDFARRHGVHILIDAAVRADGPAPLIPQGDLDGSRLELTLRELLAGNDLVFHYGIDRLETVWVFARPDDFIVRAAGAEAAPPRAQVVALHQVPGAERSADMPGLGLRDLDENVRLQALTGGTPDSSPPGLNDLRQLVDADPSEAVRMQAMEALVSHPEASEEEIRAMLDRMSDHPVQLLAEHARTLREARAAATEGLQLMPEPIEERP